MIRKVLFGCVLLTAFIIVACGRQVTPNPPGISAGGAPVGYMVVKFDVAGQFNFSNYQYWIVFNTTGNGLTPGTIPFQSNWAAYSSAIEVGGNATSTYAHAVQWVKNSNPAIPPAVVNLITTPQQLQYTADSNGSGTEFSVLFQRQIFASISGATPTPTTHPSATSSSSTPTPSPLPFSSTWTFNAFVTQANTQNQMVFVNSMGAGGPNNPQYVCCSPALVITQNTDNIYYASNSGVVSDPTAQIVSIEIGNNYNQQ